MAYSLELVQRFWRLPWPDRLLLMEAVVWLAIGKLFIALLPFRQVARLAASPTYRTEPSRQIRPDRVQRIRWAVLSATARVPWRAMCFQQGLAAQLMLRRRGISSVLYYGVAQNDEIGLQAHVWVRAGELDVIGGERAGRFAVLAIFGP